MKDAIDLIETFAKNPINFISFLLLIVGLLLILASMGIIPKWFNIDGKVNRKLAGSFGIVFILSFLYLFFYFGKSDIEKQADNIELPQLDCEITKDLKQAIAAIEKNKQNQFFSNSDIIILETFLNQFNQYLSDDRRCDDPEKINVIEEEIQYIQSFIEKRLSYE